MIVAIGSLHERHPALKKARHIALRITPEISRSLLRLGEVHSLVQQLPKIERIPPGKITALWKFASIARAQAVARLPEERRTATLLAFIHTPEASAGDDVIDVLDAVSTAMFSEAESASKQARLCSIRDFDDAALKLRDIGIVVFDDATPDDQVRATIFELLGRDALFAAVA
jgi:hypothetical protein